ncbi:MAG: class I SAM-dependent methyltransferase [Bacteroidota bacterium]
MTDDISDIAAYYNRKPEAEHNRLEENQLEFDLTWRFLETYLPPKGEILEIGAGTGQYTLGLVQRGYTVTAVDISQANLDLCQKYLAEAGLQDRAQFILGDARYLRNVPKKEFDAVLLMGPLYHLVEESDRQMALREANERLRPGGIIISAFISRYGILGEILKYIPESIDDHKQVRSVLSRGRDRQDWPKGDFRAYFARVEEVAPLHEGIGFETIKVVGVEPCISANDEIYNKLEGERRRLWLDLFYEISGEPSIVGASQHLLYIGRKRLLDQLK